MQVSKCGEKAVSPAPLTWNEMKRKEGVYKCAKCVLGDGISFIVVGVLNPAVLWYDGNSLSTPVGYENQMFTPTNETVCFELKPA